MSGKFLKKHSVIAGNPAEVIRQLVTWDSNGSKYGYIENNE